MKNYIVKNVTDVHRVVIDHNGFTYNVIFGKHDYGGFFSIPNFSAGGELSGDFCDVFWNTESIGRAIDDHEVAKEIARVIAEFR